MKKKFQPLFDDLLFDRLHVGNYIILKGSSVPQKIVSFYFSFEKVYVVLCSAYLGYHIIDDYALKPSRFYSLSDGSVFASFVRSHFIMNDYTEKLLFSLLH